MASIPDNASDIEQIVHSLLNESKAYDIFPTPIAKIANFSELVIDRGIDLSKVDTRFFSKFGSAINKLLASALEKVVGAIDIREKIIYLDYTQHVGKQNFVKLHEIGHGIIPWQRETFTFLDDKYTLDPNTKEHFESEASFFASSALFQLDRFSNQARTLPLNIKSAMILARKFGSSNHAALRKYVETSTKRCALLVLEPKQVNTIVIPKIRDYFQSNSFAREFDLIQWNSPSFDSLSFVDLYKFNAKFRETQELIYCIDNKQICFEFDYFNNGYNSFVFLRPKGEKIKSRTTIKVK